MTGCPCRCRKEPLRPNVIWRGCAVCRWSSVSGHKPNIREEGERG